MWPTFCLPVTRGLGMKCPPAPKRKGTASRRIPKCPASSCGPMRLDGRPLPQHHFGGDAMASIGEKRVTIGVDPHPSSHTATAVSQLGEVLGSITVGSDAQGCQRLRRWVEQYPDRCWAIEGAGNRFVAPLVADLLNDGEQVYAIAPSMTAQYRSRRGR